jgi:ABC-type phosphate transport system auxiliary subunit
METVQQLLDKVYDLPKEDFDAFDETFKKYRIEKKREGFIKSYEEALIAKKEGKLFRAESVESLIQWLNGKYSL